MITDLLSAATLAVVLILIVPAVIGLVNMLKRAGLPTALAGPVAVVLGLVFTISYGIWGEHQLFVLSMLGILIGLGATGFYDLRKLGASDTAPLIITPLTQDPILDDGYRQVELDAPDAVGYLDDLDGISTQPERAAD